jgi:Xaa-Pro dipeptidase
MLLMLSVCHLQGKKETARNSDVMQPFRQDSNFAYLTGIQRPGFACAINSETGHFTLLAPKLDPQLVVWMGAQPSLENLAEEYGADACAYIEDFDTLMASNHNGLSIYTLPEDAQKLQELTGKHGVSAGLHSSKSNELEDAVSASRAVKTDADVACLRHASAVSAQAHMAMWR